MTSQTSVARRRLSVSGRTPLFVVRHDIDRNACSINNIIRPIGIWLKQFIVPFWRKEADDQSPCVGRTWNCDSLTDRRASTNQRMRSDSFAWLNNGEVTRPVPPRNFTPSWLFAYYAATRVKTSCRFGCRLLFVSHRVDTENRTHRDNQLDLFFSGKLAPHRFVFSKISS